jgi:hypothetical protein
MRDVILTCIQCDAHFMFSVAEQKRCDDHGFDAPRRCPECRKRKSRLYGNEENWTKKGKRKEKRYTNRFEDDEDL